MVNRKFTRRQRLLLRTGILAFLVLAIGAAAVFFRPRPPQYNPGGEVEGLTAELERSIPPDRPRVSFAEVSAEAGINFTHFYRERSTQLPEDMGSGAAWGDYDNDGDEDLFIVNICGPLTLSKEEASRSPATCHLYRNDGHGTFTDVSQEAGLQLRLCGMAAAWGDYDGDGWLDLIVTSYPDLFLFRNDHGHFVNVSRASGVGRYKGFWTDASWADYDRDGNLDLYVCGYVQYRANPADWNKVSIQYSAEIPFTLNPSSYPPERNLLFHNRGNGTFTEVARQAGVQNTTGRSLSAAWCDFDEDGRTDLYVANDVSDNAMYRNLGNGRFIDISHAVWVADYRGAMGLGVGDWDGDGDLDIFITHWLAQENALFNNMRIPFRGSKPGKTVFVDVADQQGLGQIALEVVGWGTSFFDYDNDGKPDLFVVNGSTLQDEKDKRQLAPMRHFLFWNKNEVEGFFEVALASGPIFKQQTVGRGAAFADYDGDGDVDIFVVNFNGRGWLLRNDGGNQNRWLNVKVRGRKNRFGVGAIVKVITGDRAQVQQIGSQSSYLSQNSLTAHFGVGKTEVVDRVEVTFPGGKVVRRERVSSNLTITVDET
ncbi:MAG: CRTAC1 family protein [Armatimonadetes bacterium]|nr:CRTAC1 family protein [Armatimonadota bacterium]